VTDAPELLWDGDAAAAATVLLAHGAGADCRSEFLAQVAAGLCAHGVRVARFDFDYMALRRTGVRRGPDPQLQLLACMRRAAAATAVPPAQLVLAGKSMGGRMATMLADELGVAGVVVFGYPFHAPKKPEQVRTVHLRNLRTPCLILQGERDPLGSRDDIAGYQLAASIDVQLFADGDHSLVPRVRSGYGRQQHLRRAIELAAAFAQRVAGGHAPPPALA
jgi:uncharacterized protein